MPQGRWTIGRLMLGVAACGLALGMLRSSQGRVFALIAGGVVGCGLSPMFALRGMRTLDRQLAEGLVGLPRSDPRVLRRPTLLAQAYVLIWFAWFLAGVMAAATGFAVAGWLRPHA